MSMANCCARACVHRLVKWLLNPPGVKPGTAMPNLGLSEKDAKAACQALKAKRQPCLILPPRG